MVPLIMAGAIVIAISSAFIYGLYLILRWCLQGIKRLAAIPPQYSTATPQSPKRVRCICPRCRSDRIVIGQIPVIGGHPDSSFVMAFVGPLPPPEELIGTKVICVNCGQEFTCQKKHIRNSGQ